VAGHIKRRVSKRTGRVTYQARIPHPSRPAKHIVKTFDRKADATRWLDEQKSKVMTGDFIDPQASAMLFRELMVTWERTRAAKLAPKTRERYESVVRAHLLPAFGSTPIGKLTRAVFKEWFAALDATPGTARKIQIVLSSILSEGVELGVLRDNPAARLRLAAAPRRDMTILTAEEIRAVAQAIERPSDRLAVYVAAYTGLRAGELWALRRRDLDLPGRRLAVVRTLKDYLGELEFVNATKTDGSRRVVSLPTFLVNMLTVHLDRLPADPGALIFTAPGGGGGRAEGDGGPVRHGQFVRRVFKPAVKGRPEVKARAVRNGNGERAIPARPAVPAAVPPSKQSIRWHDLRHTCAALLIAAGRHPLEIKTRLGHASITTTMDRYGHLFPSAEGALADALDVAFNESRNVEPIRRDDEPPAEAVAA
jgi:integrase